MQGSIHKIMCHVNYFHFTFKIGYWTNDYNSVPKLIFFFIFCLVFKYFDFLKLVLPRILYDFVENCRFSLQVCFSLVMSSPGDLGMVKS